MEKELAANLRTCAEAFARAKALALTTVGRLSAGDTNFFLRLDAPGASFTARKYDEVMRWFGANWPEGAEWPAGVPRPTTGVPA